MHLEVMNLPTDDRDWLPLAANPQKWWKLINKKLHEVSSGPEARATLPQRKRLIDKTRQDKENLRTFLPERSRHCAREARTCAGRGVDAPASSSSISGGLRNQRFETHYRSVRLTGKKVNRQTAVGLVQTDFINATIPGNSPGPYNPGRTGVRPGARERPRGGGRKSLPPDGSEIFCRVFPRCDFFLRTQVQPGAGTPGSNPGVVPPPGLSWVLA